MFRRFFLPRIVFFTYWLWSRTFRVRVDETPEVQDFLKNQRPIIFAHWHRDELALIHFIPAYHIATMTSTSKDGQLIDYVIRKLGGATAKGSSTRGGARALRGMVGLIQSGYRASIAVDGPKGPIFQAKPGVFELAQLTGAVVVPMGVAISSYMEFRKSWNKARLPKPFAKIIVSFGPIQRIGDADARDKTLAEALNGQIHLAGKMSETKMNA